MQTQPLLKRDLIVRVNEMDWQEFGPGTAFKILHLSEETGSYSMMVKLEPGAVFQRHFHKGALHFVVMKGEVHYRNGVVREGEFAYEPIGMLHEATTAEVETITFNHFYGPIEFLDENDKVVFTLDWKWVESQLNGAGSAEPPGEISRVR